MQTPVEIARELEARDEALAAAIADVHAVEEEVERLRARAGEIEALRERLPAERRDLEQRIADAREELDHRRAEEREAQAELERAEEKGDRERLAEARRAVVRTKDAASSASKRVERLDSKAQALEREAEEAEREAPSLEQRAAQAAARLEKLPRLSAPTPPGTGLSAVTDWGARARAALFTARNSLESERESVVREANELGAAVLGEPLFSSRVAVVRRRLEQG